MCLDFGSEEDGCRSDAAPGRPGPKSAAPKRAASF